MFLLGAVCYNCYDSTLPLPLPDGKKPDFWHSHSFHSCNILQLRNFAHGQLGTFGENTSFWSGLNRTTVRKFVDTGNSCSSFSYYYRSIISRCSFGAFGFRVLQVLGLHLTSHRRPEAWGEASGSLDHAPSVESQRKWHWCLLFHWPMDNDLDHVLFYLFFCGKMMECIEIHWVEEYEG